MESEVLDKAMTKYYMRSSFETVGCADYQLKGEVENEFNDVLY
jgi:hypothetical protein